MKKTDIDNETSIVKLQQVAKRYAKQKDKDLVKLSKYKKEIAKLEDRKQRIILKYEQIDYEAFIVQRIGEIIVEEGKKKK